LIIAKSQSVGGVEYEEKGAAMVMTQSGDTKAKGQQRGGRGGRVAQHEPFSELH